MRAERRNIDKMGGVTSDMLRKKEKGKAPYTTFPDIALFILKEWKNEQRKSRHDL